VGKNDITQGQGSSTGMPPEQKVNKAEKHQPILEVLATDQSVFR